MESTTKEIGMSLKLTDMAFMSGQTETNMWENGINAWSKGTVMTSFLTETSMKGAIWKVNFTVEVDSSGKMGWSTMGILEMEWDTGRGFGEKKKKENVQFMRVNII